MTMATTTNVTMTADLMKHASTKVQRALDDVIALAETSEMMISIALAGAISCIGSAAGMLASVHGLSGRAVPDDVLKQEIIRKLTEMMDRATEKKAASGM